MGRCDFRPARVRQTAEMLLRSNRISQQPCWYQVMQDVPPAQILVRTQPVQQNTPHTSPNNRKVKKPSRMFQPQRITYEEDVLRREFFADHPWELARPRMIIEDDGKDSQRWDWSVPHQSGRPVSGESVVQRQLWLMTQGGLSKEKAYDQARKEHYEDRHMQEVEARVAREEAMSTGAYFGQSAIRVGMHLESKEFDRWKIWAEQQVTIMEQARSAAYTGLGAPSANGELDEPDEEADADDNTGDAAAELVGASVPNTRRGQEARGGANFRT